MPKKLLQYKNAKHSIFCLCDPQLAEKQSHMKNKTAAFYKTKVKLAETES